MLKSKVVEGQVLKSMEYLFTVHVAHLQTLVIDRICTVSCRVAVALPGEGRIVLVKKKECGNVLRKKKLRNLPLICNNGSEVHRISATSSATPTHLGRHFRAPSAACTAQIQECFFYIDDVLVSILQKK